MGALPTILQTRWLELRVWPAGTAPLGEPVAVKAYGAAEVAEYLQVILVVREPLERLALAVRPAFLPAVRLSHGPAGPWEEAVAWGGCAAGEQLVFWARRQDGGRWRGPRLVPSAEEAAAPDRYAAWFSDEIRAGTP
jgi:hypothetical protein